MKKILYSKTNKVFILLMVACLPLKTPAQTVPNLYPVVCMARFIKDYCGIDMFPRDTTKKPVKQPVYATKDSCRKKVVKKDSVFVNHDKDIKKRVLKDWKY